MKTLQRIWQDARRGENIDLYVTVTVAIVLAALSITGIAPQAWIAPLSLAVLALLAAAILGNRYRLERMSEWLMQGTDSVLLDRFPGDVYDSVEKSKELWLIGVSLRSTLEVYYPLFESKLRRGDSIKVLTVTPDGEACKMAAMRNYARTNVDRQRAEIRASLMDFCELQKVAPGRLEIRTIEYPLALGVYAADLGETRGVISLKYYPFKMPIRRAGPGLVLRPKDQRWYEHFRSEIQTLWENAAPWQC